MTVVNAFVIAVSIIPAHAQTVTCSTWQGHHHLLVAEWLCEP
jgi:hypothetical protein